MTQTSPCRKFQAEDTWPRRALPCLVRGSICPTPLRALRDSKIYPKLGSFAAAATSNIARVRSVGKLAFDTVWLPASCMTSATWFPPGLATSSSFTRGTVGTKCRKFFNADMSGYALPKAHYTHRVVSLAVRLVVEDGLPYQAASWHLWRDHRVFVPFATIQNWVEAGGKKGSPTNVDNLPRLGPG